MSKFIEVLQKEEDWTRRRHQMFVSIVVYYIFSPLYYFLSSRLRNPSAPITGGKRSQKSIHAAAQIEKLTLDYIAHDDSGLTRISFMIAVQGHLLKYHKDVMG